jgi:hypothetical protein
MFQRKLIVSLAIAVLLAISAGVSQASLSRMEGMALSTPTTSQFTDDYANIFWYPTSVVRQNNLVLAELGQNSDNGGEVDEVETLDQNFTIIRNFPRLGAIAFEFAQNQQQVYTGSSNLNNEKLDVIWGRAFTKLDLALRFDLTNSKFEASDNSPASFSAEGFSPFDAILLDPIPAFVTAVPNAVVDNIEINTMGITPAVALHFGEDDRLEAAATFRKFTFDRTETPAAQSWSDQGNASYAIQARAFLHRSGTHTWVPAAWYVNDDLSWEMNGVLAGPVTADETYKFYGAGISDNMRVNDNNLLLFGVAFGEAKHSYERTDANTGGAATDIQTHEDKIGGMPLFFGAIETDATKWLKVRLGASKSWTNTTTEEATFAPVASTQVKTHTADFNLGMGVGVRFNNLDLDMTLNEQFPLSGGYILSGNSETPFNRVSATYHF